MILKDQLEKIALSQKEWLSHSERQVEREMLGRFDKRPSYINIITGVLDDTHRTEMPQA